MPLFRKKQSFLKKLLSREEPVYVEAFRLGLKGNPTPAPLWFPSPPHTDIKDNGLIVHTPESDMLAEWGDWIIMNDKGEFYTCPNIIFEADYEFVSWGLD